MIENSRAQLLADKSTLIDHIIRVLHQRSDCGQNYNADEIERLKGAGVLLLLGHGSRHGNEPRQPYLILNKRSLKVRQAGDLCCPGGSVARRTDPCFAKVLTLPVASLGRWKYWNLWKKQQPSAAESLALYWATGLREGFEEMRLNPFGVKFLGPLPPQPLVMFQRSIHPLVGWVGRQKRFLPNWEVEKIVNIPLKDLLNPANYARYELHVQTRGDSKASETMRSRPCFRFQFNHETELLWGATYRIVMVFMQYTFAFRPPDFQKLPAVQGVLDPIYFTGKR